MATQEPTAPGERELRSAIKRLYGTFNRYRLSGHVVGCPCCTSAEDGRVLESRPLHELGAGELDRFAFKGMSTLGTVEQFKHFLPRLLELAAWEGGVGDTDFEIVMGKLRYGQWAKWPHAERVAVEGFLAALWRFVLGTFPCAHDADACLCGIGSVVEDLSPFLAAWRQDNSATSARHLADLVDFNSNELFKRGRLSNAFWKEREAQLNQVIDWLCDPATIAWMENAFFQHADASFAGELSAAVDRLTWLRQKREK